MVEDRVEAAVLVAGVLFLGGLERALDFPVPSVAKRRSRVWYFKDSMRAAAVQGTTAQILARLDAAGRSGAAVYAVIDILLE